MLKRDDKSTVTGLVGVGAGAVGVLGTGAGEPPPFGATGGRAARSARSAAGSAIRRSTEAEVAMGKAVMK